MTDFAKIMIIITLMTVQFAKIMNIVGLGSIGTTSSDRQSRKIDVQDERTSIAELDTAPLPPLFSLTPKYKRAYPIL